MKKPDPPVFEKTTVDDILAIIKRNYDELRDANLLQDESKPGAKHIEWFRGAAQVLLKISSEIEFEQQSRLEARKQTAEETIEQSLGVLEQSIPVNWNMAPPPDRDAEL